MGVVFSKVSLTAEGKTKELYMGGIPSKQSDFKGWIQAEEFLNGISDGTNVKVNSKIYAYGMGHKLDATPEELAYLLMRQDKDSDFINRRCTHEGGSTLNFKMSQEIKGGKQKMQTDKSKKEYPKGTRVAIVQMNEEPDPVPMGTKGTVELVDDIGQIHVNWDNGRKIAICSEVDDFVKIDGKTMREDDKIVEVDDQVFAIIPKDPVDCSRVGFFDELEEECWDLVKQYFATMGIKIIPNSDGETPTSYYIAKEVQDKVLDQLKEMGLKMNFDGDIEGSQTEEQEQPESTENTPEMGM